MKKLLSVSAVAAIMLLGGCGNQDASCRIDVQKDIDTGNFDAAVAKLEGSCKTAYNESDRLYNLAAAYMGKAGYSVSDVIKVMVDANNNNANNSFTTFINDINKNRRSGSLDLLAQAKSYFLRSIDPSVANVQTLFTQYCESNNSTSGSRASNACFYVGFNDVIRTSVTVSQLTKDLNTTLAAIDAGNNGQVPLDMQVSVDALAWAAGKSVQNGSTIMPQNVTTIKGQSYRPLVITNNGETFYRLADDAAPSATSSTILTDGYCSADGNKSACTGIEKSDGSIDTTKIAAGVTCYACPISVENNSSSGKVTDLLVEALNNGTDAILNIANDPDIAQSVKDFKKEVTGSPDGNITVDQIINYLNAK